MDNHALTGSVILVVEDEPLIALDLRQCLEGAGASVFVATQLPQALCLAGHPDLSAAVIDYRINQEVNNAIRVVLQKRGIPFVFYNVYADTRETWPGVACVARSTVDGDCLVQAVAGVIADQLYEQDAKAA
jgi:CheY-like chemotaxis protein